MTILGLAALTGAAWFAVHIVRHHLAEVAAEQQAKHVHRPIVVMDGSVDLCSCGELVNR